MSSLVAGGGGGLVLADVGGFSADDFEGLLYLGGVDVEVGQGADALAAHGVEVKAVF